MFGIQHRMRFCVITVGLRQGSSEPSPVILITQNRPLVFSLLKLFFENNASNFKMSRNL